MFSTSKKTKEIAGIILLTMFSLAIVFHLLVFMEFIPNEIVWGGRITVKEELYIFESISIFMNLLFLLIVLFKTEKLRIKHNLKLIHFLLWFMTIMFLLNTIGNLLAKTSTETLIFTPITFISAICGLILLSKEKA
jgi:hypothetical protein